MTEVRAYEVKNLNPLFMILLAALVWLAVLTKLTLDRPSPVFVSVSLKTLLERHIETLSEDGLTSAELQASSAAYIGALEGVIDEVTRDGDVIVLVSEAVIEGGVVDLTPEVARLADERVAATKPEAAP